MRRLVPHRSGKRKLGVGGFFDAAQCHKSAAIALTIGRQGTYSMTKPTRDNAASGVTGGRKERLADALRANLQKRKAQARSRRAGAADSRPDGLVTPKGGKSG